MAVTTIEFETENASNKNQRQNKRRGRNQCIEQNGDSLFNGWPVFTRLCVPAPNVLRKKHNVQQHSIHYNILSRCRRMPKKGDADEMMIKQSPCCTHRSQCENRSFLLIRHQLKPQRWGSLANIYTCQSSHTHRHTYGYLVVLIVFAIDCALFVVSTFRFTCFALKKADKAFGCGEIVS